MLLKQESTLRRVHRRTVQCMAGTSELAADLKREIRGVLHIPNNGELGYSGTTPTELQDRLREALANSTMERRRMLRTHDKDNRLKKLK
eukprot:402834-Prorocentrum_minimum.AAC.1